MGYVINTNTNAMNAQSKSFEIQRDLDSSLEKLASGLRINKAADDASGLAIADSLRSQATGLTQAIRNANDAIGIIQIADKAMDEQIKILDTIRTKAIQSAQDGQTTNSRKALQSDIVRLLEELDNIAATTTYNGKSLLAGGFTDKEFQIGAYSHQTVKASIGATSSDKIGQTRFETGKPVKDDSVVHLKFEKVNGRTDIELEQVVISTSVGTGLGALAEIINKNSDQLQVRASANVQVVGSKPIGTNRPAQAGQEPAPMFIRNLKINGSLIGNVIQINPADSDNKIIAAINNIKEQTGINASTDPRGHIVLTSMDGRGIQVEATEGLDYLGFDKQNKNDNVTAIDESDATKGDKLEHYGRLTLIRNDARDIAIVQKRVNDKGIPQINSEGDYIYENESATSIGYGRIGTDHAASEDVINLRAIRGAFTINNASAMGYHSSYNTAEYIQNTNGEAGAAPQIPTGVTTFVGSQTTIDIADTAIRMLDAIRSDLGSVQIQLEATVNNVSTTRTNVKFSESQIRDVDFSDEISEFQKKNVLIQAGNYALSQSNAIQQNVLKLLQ